MITSRQNEFVKRVASLKDKKYRAAYGEYIIEGVKQVREAIACGQDVGHIVVSESYAGDVFDAGKTVCVSDGVFAKLSEESSPQGILAVLKLPKNPLRPPEGNCLLLDGVSDPGNLGTIIRTANAAGYGEIYLLGCADPYAPKCVRSAMSGIFFVDLFRISETGMLFEGVPLICADMGGENVFSLQKKKKFCLVIGNEANGVSESVRRQCAFTVRIPMRGSCESLNAGVSAGILMYELTKGASAK